VIGAPLAPRVRMLNQEPRAPAHSAQTSAHDLPKQSELYIPDRGRLSWMLASARKPPLAPLLLVSETGTERTYYTRVSMSAAGGHSGRHGVALSLPLMTLSDHSQNVRKVSALHPIASVAQNRSKR
jgi:hypothetical protein